MSNCLYFNNIRLPLQIIKTAKKIWDLLIKSLRMKSTKYINKKVKEIPAVYLLKLSSRIDYINVYNWISQ